MSRPDAKTSQLKKSVVSVTSECRICGRSELQPILSLGNQYVSDFVASDGTSPQAPLDLVRCSNCGLVQLRHSFSRDSLYHHYWYKSGISSTMRKALSELVNRTCEIARPKPNDIVVDIGANDGTLLRSYTVPSLLRVGFEPAQNLVEEARKGTDLVFNDYFKADLFLKEFASKKARIVSSIAMFYDLEDPNRFVTDVTRILAPGGVWVVQQNYLATMLERNGFDNIGHEHLEYYTLRTMQELLNKHGLEVFEAETNDVNGGSFRTFICRTGDFPASPSVKKMQSDETRLGLGKESAYKDFARRISDLSKEIHDFVSSEVEKGKTVYVYGASNRGNTILQYCGLDHKLIRKATDANPEKWGRRTAGTLIPIVSKEEARRDNPDYFLILPHHFLAEIRKDEKRYLDEGGKFIVPLPHMQIIDD